MEAETTELVVSCCPECKHQATDNSFQQFPEAWSFCSAVCPECGWMDLE